MEPSGFDYVARQIPIYRDLLLPVPDWVKRQAFDIHIAIGQPVSICGREGTLFPCPNGQVSRLPEEGTFTTRQQLRELFLQACGHSVFRHERELRQGYVWMGENCRVGVCGSAVVEGTSLRSVRDITSLVYRIPRQVMGCGDRLFLEHVPVEQGILVVGPPSSGKTTFLRDVARSLSLGRFGPGCRVAVVDERGELGGFDLGPNADLLQGYPKAIGFDVAVRMLSPQFVLCDELSDQDLEAIRGVAAAGVPLIASVHGDADSLTHRPLCKALLQTGAFQTAVCLAGRRSPGEIASFVASRQWGQGGGEAREIVGRGVASAQRGTGGAAGCRPPETPGTVVA